MNPNELQAIANQMASQAQPITTVDVPIQQPAAQPAQRSAQPAQQSPVTQPQPRRINLPSVNLSDMQWLSSLASLFGCLWLITAPLLVASNWFPPSHVAVLPAMGSFCLIGFLAIRDTGKNFPLYGWAWTVAFSGYVVMFMGSK